MLMSTNKFFKDRKTAQTHRACAIFNLWKICECLLHQIAREIMQLLFHNLHENNISERKDRRNYWMRARYLSFAPVGYSFALVLLENALVFSQSEYVVFLGTLVLSGGETKSLILRKDFYKGFFCSIMVHPDEPPYSDKLNQMYTITLWRWNKQLDTEERFL